MTHKIIALTSLLLVLGCNKLDDVLFTPPPPVPPPPTANISADFTTVLAGTDVVLTVSSDANAKTGVISPIDVQMLNGNTTVQPQETTTYVFKVTGDGGSAVDVVTVNVTYPPPTASIVASRDTVAAGETVTLAVSSTDADQGLIIPTGASILNDSLVVSLMQTTTYLYVVSGRGGVAFDAVTVVVGSTTAAPPTATITASPNPVDCVGCETTITVASTGATMGTVVWASGADGPNSPQMMTSGSFRTGSISQATTFVFAVVGPGGSAQDSVTVTVP